MKIPTKCSLFDKKNKIICMKGIHKLTNISTIIDINESCTYIVGKEDDLIVCKLKANGSARPISFKERLKIAKWARD
jgi:hypothetical protein